MKHQEIISRLSEIILSWENTCLGRADFGAVAFLFNGREFGHIHQSGELDIAFGKIMTEALLKSGLVETHQYVPKSSITYRVKNLAEIPFATALLRLSYFLTFKPRNQKIFDFLMDFESDLNDTSPQILAVLKNF